MPGAIIIGQGGGGGTGGGGNASVGLTGATAPTSATEIGIIVAGNLQGVSNANPLPITGSITASNPSVGTIGATAPTSATFLGVVNGSGNLEGVGSANPIRIDPTGTTAQPVLITGHAGATLDGTAGSPSAGVITVQGVSGGTPTPVSLPAAGNTALATWNSSTGTGTVATILSAQPGYGSVVITLFNGVISGGTFSIEASTDGTNYQQLPLWSVRQNLPIANTVATPFSTGTLTQYLVNIAGYPYLQVRLVTSITGAGTIAISYSLNAVGSEYAIQIVTPQMAALSDGNTTDGLLDNVGVVRSTGVTVGFVTSGGAGPAVSFARTPSIFTGGQGGASAGAFVVWNPQYTKKIRLMKYKIEIGEDATLSGGGAINIGFRFGTPNGLSATQSITRLNQPAYWHRTFIPSSVFTANGELFNSGWIDLQNGVSPFVAGQPMYCGIQIPQGSSGVTPTWTLPSSGQWEAGIQAFTTTNGDSAFRQVQYATQSSTASTVQAMTAVPNGRGNAVFVFIRSTNVAGGAPTNTITDTAGNTWTKLTIVTNASDGAHGCSLQLIYCLNMQGTDANLATNTITNTATVNVPAAQQAIALEYQYIKAADSTAQLTATGNSANPACSSYAPTSTGTLILSYGGTNTAQATGPSVNSAFFPITQQGGNIGAILFVADNFGNGALSAGLVNVICIGTEE